MRPDDIAQTKVVLESWISQGSDSDFVQDPTGGATIADSGALAEGWYNFMAVIGGTIDHVGAQVQHRNAVNNSTLHSWLLQYGAYQNTILYINNWRMEPNERMRIQHIGAATGAFRCSLSWVRKA